MRKNLKVALLCSSLCLSLGLVACHSLNSELQIAEQQKQQQKISKLFVNAKTEGVFVTYDGQKIHEYGNALNRAQTSYIPASTFKMLNALIGIQHHKTTPNEVFKWNGEKRRFKSWEKDLTLTEAIQASAVPIYQELARRIGLDMMASEVKRIGFGNSDIGNQVDNFWLVGPLKITPIQEVRFAYALANEQLAFDIPVQQQVKQMLLVDQVNGTKVYAKSGWGMDVEPQVGWWTGWVEQPDGKITAFSLNMEMNKTEHVEARKTIVYEALQQLGLIQH
ncbi:OXA-266 family class D beta-lactamase OXA-661 [Acinetobacter venetianus]|uniref:beta-lactamase n=1 Tax=Acinetobacter venetianus TaxID=52133 RepID=A0A2Z5FPK6_9GAMM|nr:OXA-266 family class D beta-lactamase OXA-661 [Acinetobacter venetianus]AXC08553.1 OXA-266 family class D beta-lactamase OXA-661 [Acinetobacter venetianus]RZG88202.1 OXA-266 family class D beta-lactamase OXA-661 [Acinetobacter venetianus]